MVLAIGAAAPDFTLPDELGHPISLQPLVAMGPVALVFYPRDFTPVCTRELCMVRDVHSELTDMGIRVLGISADDIASHARFREQHALPFPLLADPNKSVHRAYGVIGAFGLPRRVTFLIGRGGRVVDVADALLRVGPHAALLGRARGLARQP